MSAQDLVNQANHAFQAGDTGRAMDLLARVNQSDPAAYASALLLMGRIYMRQGDLQEARSHFEASYDVKKNARTLFHLGECLYQQGDRDAAEECFEKATQVDATLTDAFIMLGVVRKEGGRAKEAIASFDRALKNDPKAMVARYQIAQVTFELGDMQRAAAQTHHVIAQAPQFAPAHLLMANITMKLGDYRQAAVAFCKVLDISGPDHALYLSLGRAFAHLQDLPQSLLAFEAAFQMDPASELACSAVARLAERMGNLEKAGEYYRQLLAFEGSVGMATEALERLGLPTDVPPPKTKKRGKGDPPPPPVTFNPPKMLDKAGLPNTTPSRTGRIIGGASPTAPLNAARSANARTDAPQPFVPGAGRSRPTTPLDQVLDQINRIIDKTPLKGTVDAHLMGDHATTIVKRLGGLIDKVKKERGAEGTDTAPPPAAKPAPASGPKPATPPRRRDGR
ncbi:MAG: tetratricopeptide repeat protein [bacterium]|nr:tetratricopeptide repeat protein [bacterium]